MPQNTLEKWRDFHAEIARLRADNERMRHALVSIVSYCEREFREGDKGYQAAIVARNGLEQVAAGK